MGAWPLPTGDSLVVPSRAQVNLLGPCDRSFQRTPLTVSSAARPIARETPSPGAARHVGMGACNHPRVLQSCRSTPDVGSSSSSEEYRWSTSKRTECNCNSVEPTHGEACCRRCVPAVSFHLVPHSPYRPVLERERNTQVDRCLGRIARAASSWVTQAARCFGCRTESSRSTTTEPS